MKSKNSDEIETIISRSLQFGVLLSAVIMIIGLVMFIVTGNGGYAGDNVFPTSLAATVQGILALKPYAIISAGLLILIVTPVFRVGVSIIVFLKEKDFIYVKITALVFIILLISFLLGKVE